MAPSETADSDSLYQELKSYFPGELKEEIQRIEHELEQTQNSIELFRPALEDRVETLIRRYGPDASSEEIERATRRVGRGDNSQLYNSTIKLIKKARRRGEIDPRILHAFNRPMQEAKELRRDLAQKRTRIEELRHRRRVAEQVLDDWEDGQVEIGTLEDAFATDNLSTAEKRTLEIGRALLEYGDTRSETPEFHGSKKNFKEWAGNVLGDDGTSKSKTTVYNALLETDCWENPRQGDSTGLGVILDRTITFTEECINRSQNSN